MCIYMCAEVISIEEIKGRIYFCNLGNSQKVKVVVVIFYVCKYNGYIRVCSFVDIEKRNHQ